MRRRSQATILWPLALAVFFQGYARSVLSVTLPYVGRSLGAGPPGLSLAVGVVSLGALGVLAVAPAADRVGRRRVLLGCLAGMALASAGTATSDTLTALSAWQLASRTFQEGTVAAAAVIAAEEVGAASRGLAQRLLGGAATLGSGVAALLLAFVEVVPYGWRGLYVGPALALTLAVPLLALMPESHRWTARRAGPPLPRQVPRPYRRRLALLAATTLFAEVGDLAPFSFATYVPIAIHGWSPGATTVLLLGAGALGLPGAALGGRLADRLGRRPSAVIFLLGLAGAELLFFLGPEKALWPGFAGMIFCQAGKVAVLRAWATELFPTAVRARAAGWIAAAGVMGAVAGYAGAAAAASTLGDIRLALALLTPAAAIAATLAFVTLPESRCRELEALAPEHAPRR